MDCSPPSFPVLHYFPEFTQTLGPWVSDTISPSHPLPPTSPFALNLSQHQGLFQWVNTLSGGQSTRASGSASVLPLNIQGWFPLGLTGLISLQYKGFSRIFISTTIQKHQFFGAQASLWSNPHMCTWLLEKPYCRCSIIQSCQTLCNPMDCSTVFPMSIQGQFPLRLTGLISLVSKGLSGVFSSTIVRRHQFFSPPPSLWSSSHNHTWPLGRP